MSTFFIAVTSLIFSVPLAYAQFTSTNYLIDSYIIGEPGGVYSSSTNFIGEDGTGQVYYYTVSSPPPSGGGGGGGGTPDPDPIPGCTDPTATNYDEDATFNDGSCMYPEPPPDPTVPGCTDPVALNYNGSATVNDGSCTYPDPDPPFPDPDPEPDPDPDPDPGPDGTDASSSGGSSGGGSGGGDKVELTEIPDTGSSTLEKIGDTIGSVVTNISSGVGNFVKNLWPWGGDNDERETGDEPETESFLEKVKKSRVWNPLTWGFRVEWIGSGFLAVVLLLAVIIVTRERNRAKERVHPIEMHVPDHKE